MFPQTKIGGIIMQILNCIVCRDEINVESNVITGEIMECSSCGQEHEVQVNGDSITLALAPEIEETWGE